MINLRIGSSALACAALTLGCQAAGSPTETIGPSAAPTAVADPSAAATITTLGSGQLALDAGTYRLDLDERAGGGTAFPAFLVTVPEGWHTFDGWILDRPRSGEEVPPVAVQFWDVDQVYGHPCQWDGTLFQPGPTVDDLAEALVDVPLRNATQPVDVTIDGHVGKYLEWSVPADLTFSRPGFPEPDEECDSDSGGTAFQSWTANGWATNRYHQGAGQLDRLWIVDLDGARLVIDAFSMPYASDADIEQLLDVVESISFLDE